MHKNVPRSSEMFELKRLSLSFLMVTTSVYLEFTGFRLSLGISV